MAMKIIRNLCLVVLMDMRITRNLFLVAQTVTRATENQEMMRSMKQAKKMESWTTATIRLRAQRVSGMRMRETFPTFIRRERSFDASVPFVAYTVRTAIRPTKLAVIYVSV
jgi:hypothetical protein